VNDIKSLVGLLPLWSSVMVPYFGYGNITASSAPVENEFSDLKTRVFRNMNLPIRLDDFIFYRIKTMEGTMKLAAADYYYNHNTIDSYEKNVFTDKCNDTTFQTKTNNENGEHSNKRFEQINLHENYTEYIERISDTYELENDEDENAININEKILNNVMNESNYNKQLGDKKIMNIKMTLMNKTCLQMKIMI